jgi:hypothetical protein
MSRPEQVCIMTKAVLNGNFIAGTPVLHTSGCLLCPCLDNLPASVMHGIEDIQECDNTYKHEALESNLMVGGALDRMKLARKGGENVSGPFTCCLLTTPVQGSNSRSVPDKRSTSPKCPLERQAIRNQRAVHHSRHLYCSDERRICGPHQHTLQGYVRQKDRQGAQRPITQHPITTGSLTSRKQKHTRDFKIRCFSLTRKSAKDTCG